MQLEFQSDSCVSSSTGKTFPMHSSSSSSSIRSSRPVTANPNRISESKFVVDWNSPSTSLSKIKTNETNENLQNAFRRFRQQRMDEIRIAKRVEFAKKKKIRRSDPSRMYRLRLKFVEQAKRYLGIPYAKKYFQPGTPEYESKLFLDCCGLVRRVMYDLSKEFGFVIGPWNQSYMFDTLPTTITHLDDVKPGDLVFITATYYNPKMKKQRHNLTHVEIMLGDGEKTIGARWNNGTVQYFDSYKFVSKSYHSQIYTIKSLDPWLKGICKSYCSEHSWRRRQPTKLNRKSIFYSSDQTNREHHRRSHSKRRNELSSNNSSSKKTRHRTHRRRSKRSKSHRRSISARIPTENNDINQNDQSLPLSETLNKQSISDDETDDNQMVDILADQFNKINCQDDQEQCDDSDSLDDALDAENLDDDENLLI